MSVAEKTTAAAKAVSDCDQSWICPFVAQAAEVNLGAVLIGGLLGGVLQPVFARLDPDRKNPTPLNYLWTGLLGLAAAGVAVYVAADSKTADPIRLLFFSIVCGLAFPAVLTRAVTNLGNTVAEVQQDVANAAEQARSNQAADVVQAADQLKSTLARNPIDAVGSKGAPVVEATAQIAVQNIADTAAQNTATAADVVNQLQQIGTVAKTAGYAAIVAAVVEELRKLVSADIDDGSKTAARKAIDWLTTT